MKHLVLSTKLLSSDQKTLVKHGNIQWVEYNAIEIEQLNFNINEDFDNYIFTSQNAVAAFLKVKMSPKNCFCVGAKTRKLLEENGRKVVKMAENSEKLADFIVKNYKNQSFLFFCGNLRRPELSSALEANKVALKEVEVYRTTLVPQTFEETFDGVLFFSPSAVKSFIQKNEFRKAIAFCIGETTAYEAKKYTSNVVVAKSASVEEVVALLNKPEIFTSFHREF